MKRERVAKSVSWIQFAAWRSASRLPPWGVNTGGSAITSAQWLAANSSRRTPNGTFVRISWMAETWVNVEALHP